MGTRHPSDTSLRSPADPAPAGRRPGRPRDPELEQRRRREILAIAALVFARTGYNETDVQVIADQLGIGKGTIYRYFPTKRDLFLAAVDQGLNELTEAVNQVILDESQPLRSRLEQVVLTYLVFFANRPEMVELFVQERAVFRDRHQPLYFTFRDSNQCEPADRFVEQLIAEGIIRPLPVEHYHNVISDLMYGTVLTNNFAQRKIEPATQAQQILDVLWHGILKDKPSRQAKPDKEQTS